MEFVQGKTTHKRGRLESLQNLLITIMADYEGLITL